MCVLSIFPCILGHIWNILKYIFKSLDANMTNWEQLLILGGGDMGTCSLTLCIFSPTFTKSSLCDHFGKLFSTFCWSRTYAHPVIQQFHSHGQTHRNQQRWPQEDINYSSMCKWAELEATQHPPTEKRNCDRSIRWENHTAMKKTRTICYLEQRGWISQM